MFANQTTDQVTITDEKLGDVTVIIQKLSWRTLDKAEDLRSEWALARQAKFTPAMMQAVNARADEKNADKPAVAEKPKEHPYASYDTGHVLTAGIKSWSAEIDGKPVPVAGTKGIDALDLASVDKLKKAILDLSLPPLDGEEAARKND